MNKDVIAQSFGILKYVEFPLFKVIRQLKYGGPLSRTDVDDLAQSLLIFLNLVLVNLDLLSVNFF